VRGAPARPVRNLSGGVGLAQLVTFAILTPSFWWTMHFLLAGRVSWRRLLPSAIATGLFFAGLGVFSKFYFSSTIIHDSQTFGSIGAIFGILTWFVAIGAVLVFGAVAGAVWRDRSASRLRPTARLSTAWHATPAVLGTRRRPVYYEAIGAVSSSCTPSGSSNESTSMAKDGRLVIWPCVTPASSSS
jgi:Virulence factor BrkB